MDSGYIIIAVAILAIPLFVEMTGFGDLIRFIFKKLKGDKK